MLKGCIHLATCASVLVKVGAALWTVRLCGEQDSVVLCFPINSSGWELQLFN